MGLTRLIKSIGTKDDNVKRLSIEEFPNLPIERMVLEEVPRVSWKPYEVLGNLREK